MENIVFPKIILVEGMDEVNFFDALLKHMKIPNVKVINCNGKENIKNIIATLPALPQFDDIVKSIAIIRDADNNSEAAFKSVCGSIEASGLKPPLTIGSFSHKVPKIGIYIMPGDSDVGVV